MPLGEVASQYDVKLALAGVGRSGLTGLRTPLTLSRMVKGCLRPFMMRSLIRKSCSMRHRALAFSLESVCLKAINLCPKSH